MRVFVRLLMAIGCCGLLVAGCDMMPTRPDTGLYGTATHTGTLTILRVDDGWYGDPEARSSYRFGDGMGNRGPRFVPLRGKNDVAPFDVPSRRATSEDFVTVALNAVFIKYFKEGTSGASTGEIAMILSFSAGTTVKQDFLVVSSRGQTFGSFLDFQDWPVIGPVQIDGDSLVLRIVILEIDQIENEAMRQFIGASAGFANTVFPQSGAISGIASGIAEFLISQNSDDVVFDQRFSMQRMDEGTVVNRMPLLYGKYVLVMHEDTLASDDSVRTVPVASQVPVPDDMRFDRFSDRLYRIYPYKPSVSPAVDCDIEDVTDPYFAHLDFGHDPIEWSQFFPLSPDDAVRNSLITGRQDYAVCALQFVNSDDSQSIRRTQLGFETPYIGDLEIFSGLDRAMKVAYLESIRTSVVDESSADAFARTAREYFPDIDVDGAIALNYPIIQYPEAHVLLAQYPLHTHLVLSVDRSLGGAGSPYHDQFQNFSEFLESELQSVRDKDRIGELMTLIQGSVSENTNQRVHIRQAAALTAEDDESSAELDLRRTCYLWANTLDSEGEQYLSDAMIYNEIYHLTGFRFIDEDAVVDYLKDQGMSVDKDERTCVPTDGGE